METMIVAIIEGGYSHEKVVSLKSAQTVHEHLNKEKYKTFRVRIDSDGWYGYTNDGKYAPINRNDFSMIVDGEHIKFEYAFIVIHGTPGEDGKLQAYFDMMNIPYNTCNQLLSTLTFNKFICNTFLSKLGIPVAKAILVTRGAQYDKEHIVKELGLPCFVKPADGGSSFGVTKVKNISQLDDAIKLATENGNGTQALIEQFLDGREVTNGVYRNTKETKVLPVTEIISKNEFFDYNAKYAGDSEEITPAKLSDEMTLKVKSLTNKIYNLLNMSGLARIDYIIVKDEPYMIEINTVPGQSSASIVPQMARAEGIPLSQIFDEIIECSLSI